MKIKVLLIVLSLLGYTLTSAQESEGSLKKNIVSVKAGVAVSKTLSRGLSTSNIIGYHLCVSDQINLSKTNPLYLETGLAATLKGYKISGYEDSETKLHYLQLPVLLNYHIGYPDRLEFVPFGGFYGGLCLSGKLKYNEESDTFKELDVFKEGSLNRFDFGAQFGADIVLNRFLIGFVYDLGLLEIDEKDVIYGNDNRLGYKNLKNRTAIVRVGFKF